MTKQPQTVMYVMQVEKWTSRPGSELCAVMTYVLLQAQQSEPLTDRVRDRSHPLDVRLAECVKHHLTCNTTQRQTLTTDRYTHINNTYMLKNVKICGTVFINVSIVSLERCLSVQHSILSDKNHTIFVYIFNIYFMNFKH